MKMDFTKRRKLLKLSDLTGIFSFRSVFVFVFSFFFLFVLLSYNFLIFPSSTRPTRILPNPIRPVFSVLSSSVTNSVTTIPNYTHFALPELRIQARVLLPDSLLILLSKDARNRSSDELRTLTTQKIHCVYPKNSSLVLPPISVDDYDEFRWSVRCPLPPANHSSSASLRWRHDGGLIDKSESSVSFPAWDKVAYEAVIDSGTAVVFVKGFNLRRDKKFDPNRILCRFESGMTTTSVAVAQEVVRCPLPEKSLHAEIEMNGGVKVAVDWPGSGQLVPSVARLYSESYKFGNRGADDVYNKYNLCGCTMVWNQAQALREWVVYHARLGVQRWFVYDNNSEDGLRSEVESLDSEGFNVTRHSWPWIKSQEAGFSHCVLRSKRECNWLAFFDVDEFYYFPPTKRSRIDNQSNSLGELVAEHSGFGEIRTNCRSFGPSGLTSRPSRGVMVGYTCRLRSSERHKSIVRPEAVDITLANVVHHFELRKGFVYKNVVESRAVINHYKYQAWDAFKSKFSRRVSTYVADWGDDSNSGSKDRVPGLGKEAVRPRDWERWFCQVWDTGLRDFVVANFADCDSGSLPWERSSASL